MSIDGSIFNPDAYPLDAGKEWIRYKIVEEDKVKTIEFYVEVAKVQTMADGGVRVVLDLGEDGRKVMEALTECKQNGMVLDVKAAPRPN